MSEHNKKEAYFIYGILLLYSFAQSMMISVTSVFLLSKGINFVQLNSLDSLLLLLGIFLEIPTGVIGDRFGHKISFQVSMILKAFYFLLLPLSSSFLTLMALSVILALAEATWSGSFVAWYMGKLNIHKNDSGHIHLFSNAVIVTSIAGIIAGFIGAQITKFSIEVGYYLSSFLIFFAAFLLLFISDTPSEKLNNTDKTIWQILKTFFSFVSNSNANARFLILGMFIGHIVISGIDNFWQPLILHKSTNKELFILGYSWVFIRTATLVAALISKRVRRHRLLQYMSVALSSLALLAVALTNSWIVASLAFSVHALAWVMFAITSEGMLYKHIPTNAQATVLSGIAMVNSLAGIIGLTTFAIIAEKQLAVTFIVASVSIMSLWITIFKREGEE